MSIKWVAEVGSNHNQDLKRCLAFIDKAAELGCWGVKFQYFEACKLWTKEPTVNKMRQWELSAAQIPAIYKRCKEKDIRLGCSVFNIEDIEWLDAFVDFFKIGSYEIKCEDLIVECYNTGRPLVISAGLIDDWAMEDLLYKINDYSSDIKILHCNSHYPAKIDECDMGRIAGWVEQLGIDVGWSDHTGSPGVIYQAVGQGASMIEFHMDLDGEGNEYPVGHCWLPDEIEEIIDVVKDMEFALQNKGSNKKLLKMRTDPRTYKRNV